MATHFISYAIKKMSYSGVAIHKTGILKDLSIAAANRGTSLCSTAVVNGAFVGGAGILAFLRTHASTGEGFRGVFFFAGGLAGVVINVTVLSAVL
ncbi:MAG: hypothetical protein GY938_32980 [Ketobacter sp.]|nr:hypothetical protein [Ketobacter sp.]